MRTITTIIVLLLCAILFLYEEKTLKKIELNGTFATERIK